MYPKIFLKPGKEKPIMGRHHWIFSGAIMKIEPDVHSGSIVDVYSADHKYLGTGYYNTRTSISVRLLSFEPTEINENFIWNKIYSAWSFRQKLFSSTNTTGYRLFFSEGDFFPGLIIDYYNGGLVLQIETLGIDNMRSSILEVLDVMLKPSFIFEKSDSPARLEEGLAPVKKLHKGASIPSPFFIKENNITFRVDIPEGQKTGFFFDQRENRQLIGQLANAKTILNCFGYSGAFSVYAALGGAKNTTTVDVSKKALELAKQNFTANEIEYDQHNFEEADVFEYLRHTDEKFDIIILDPPAFARRHSSLSSAFRGYKDINANAIRILKSGGYLLSCSCSYYVDVRTFQKILYTASLDAKKNVQILKKLSQPPDHPINIFHPESEYLKAFLCRVI